MDTIPAEVQSEGEVMSNLDEGDPLLYLAFSGSDVPNQDKSIKIPLFVLHISFISWHNVVRRINK